MGVWHVDPGLVGRDGKLWVTADIDVIVFIVSDLLR